MIKREMIELLVSEYGYTKDELKDNKGNFLRNDQLEALIKEEEAKLEEVEEAEAPDTPEEKEEDIFDLDATAFAPKHNFKDEDLILCMSGVNGEYYFSSPLSNFRAQTAGFGQTLKIPYGDLKYVHNITPKAFEDGDIVVLNQDIREEFGLGDIHKRVITPKNVRRVLKMSASDLSQFIANMPKGMKASLYDEARKLYRRGDIDSIQTVRIIEEEFGVSLEDNAPTKDVIGN